MHGAAQSAIEAGFTREDFAVGAVHEKPQSQASCRPTIALLHRPEESPIAVRLHDVEQLSLAQFTNGGKCFGKNLAVAAVRAEDMVFGVERECHTHRGSL